MSSPSLRDPQLATLYQRTPGAVAFIDESYRANPFPGQRPFYEMSAVTFDKARLDEVREVLTDIAGGLYWHTTEAFELNRGPDISRMTRYLARQVEWSIVTVEATITDRGMDEARQTCLAAISREVTRGAGSSSVRLLVADRNRDEALNRADQRTVTNLRRAGDIDPQVTLYHGRMGREPMLWAADVISWSAYRTLAVDDGRWLAPVRDVLTVIDARTGTAVDMKQPQAAAATPGAQHSTGRSGPNVVASESSLPENGTERGFLAGSHTLDDLVERVARLRRDAGVAGVVEGNTPAAIRRRVERLAAEVGAVEDAPSARRRDPRAGGLTL